MKRPKGEKYRYLSLERGRIWYAREDGTKRDAQGQRVKGTGRRHRIDTGYLPTREGWACSPPVSAARTPST